MPRSSKRVPRLAGRPLDEPGLGLVVEPQPDDVSCGPACLHGVYRYYGDPIDLADVVADIRMLDLGGTLDVFLANHALRRGYRATLYTYNLALFDPTWFPAKSATIREKLIAQAEAKEDPKLRLATRGYVEFLDRGGRLRLRDLEPRLLRRLLGRGAPLITGLSATYLYRSMRGLPHTNDDDDVRGTPVGHFVVLTGYLAERREVLVADPYLNNPFARSGQYAVRIHRLINAVLLGIVTYDANLLVIEPPPGSDSAGDLPA
jgi:hypothetical protein